MNAVRFEKDGKIFFTIYAAFGNGLNNFDSITAPYCKACDLPFKEGSAEDEFCEKLQRRLERRHRWRKALGSIKSFFVLSKK